MVDIFAKENKITSVVKQLLHNKLLEGVMVLSFGYE